MIVKVLIDSILYIFASNILYKLLYFGTC